MIYRTPSSTISGGGHPENSPDGRYSFSFGFPIKCCVVCQPSTANEASDGPDPAWTGRSCSPRRRSIRSVGGKGGIARGYPGSGSRNQGGERDTSFSGESRPSGPV